MMDAKDLSPADWAALQHLRCEISIAVDKAGQHAPSLQRLAGGGLILFTQRSSGLQWSEVTEAQRQLGYTMGSGVGIGGVRYADVPSWMWPCAWARYESDVRRLMRQHEGRKAAIVDWDDFCGFIVRSYGQRKEFPTIERAAARFGITVEQMTDVVDDFYWAFRNSPKGVPLGRQTIELEGE